MSVGTQGSGMRSVTRHSCERIVARTVSMHDVSALPFGGGSTPPARIDSDASDAIDINERIALRLIN